MKMQTDFRNINYRLANALRTLCMAAAIFAGTNAMAASLVRIKLTNGVSNDETVVYLQEGASNGFDASYDSYKLSGTCQIAQSYGNILLAINGIPSAPVFTVHLYIKTPAPGNFSIDATDVENLPAGTGIFLVDGLTGATYDISKTSYAFIMANSIEAGRFTLRIEMSDPGMVSESPDDTGKIKIKGHGRNKYLISNGNLPLTNMLISIIDLASYRQCSTVSCSSQNASDPLIVDLGALNDGHYLISVFNKGEVAGRKKVVVTK